MRKNDNFNLIFFSTCVHSCEQIDHCDHGDQKPSIGGQRIVHSVTWTDSPGQNWPLLTGVGLLQWRTRFCVPIPHFNPCAVNPGANWHGDQLPQLDHSPFTIFSGQKRWKMEFKLKYE